MVRRLALAAAFAVAAVAQVILWVWALVGLSRWVLSLRRSVRKGKRGKGKENERERERESVCVCVEERGRGY